MDENERANIFGRIVALEIMMRQMLTAQAANFPNPVAGLAFMKDELFSSLQNAERPIGEFNDLAWEQAIEALEELFDGTEQRLSSLFPE